MPSLVHVWSSGSTTSSLLLSNLEADRVRVARSFLLNPAILITMKKIMRICFAVLISILLVIPSSTASIYAEDTGGDILEGTSSDYIIVEDQSTGNVNASKNADKKMFPASMTKMMSIILAIENLTDLNQTITITNEMLSGLYEANASVAGFASGDQPSV